MKVSDSIANKNTIIVSFFLVELPPPTVTVISDNTSTAGQMHSLTCIATTKDFVVNLPILEWIQPTMDVGADIALNEQINGTVSANRSLTFNPLKTSNGGRYTCRARIDISLVGIMNRSDSSTVDVRVKSTLRLANHLSLPYLAIIIFCHAVPTSQVSVRDNDIASYNGTVFRLTAVIHLDLTVVNTDITIKWIWSYHGRVLETKLTTSPSPQQTTTELSPLMTNSSGQYLQNLTVIPVDSYEYVVENNDSGAFYELNVERKFAYWQYST